MEEERTFPCTYCNLSFTKHEYALHRVTNPHIKKLRRALLENDFTAICRVCRCTLKDLRNVEAHVQEEGHKNSLGLISNLSSNKFTCYRCGVVFQSELAKEVHSLMPFHAAAGAAGETPKLNELFMQLSGLPVVNEVSFQVLSCAICDRLFDALDQLCLHFFSSEHFNRLRSSSCIVCKKEFTHISDRETHLRGSKHQNMLQKSKSLLEDGRLQMLGHKGGHMCMFCMVWCHSWCSMELHVLDSYHGEVVCDIKARQPGIAKINFSAPIDIQCQSTSSCDSLTVTSWEKWRKESDRMAAWCHKCGIILSTPDAVNEHLQQHSPDRSPLASKSHIPSSLETFSQSDLFECSYCMLSFKTAFWLTVHEAYYEHHKRMVLQGSNDVRGCCAHCGVVVDSHVPTSGSQLLPQSCWVATKALGLASNQSLGSSLGKATYAGFYGSMSQDMMMAPVPKNSEWAAACREAINHGTVQGGGVEHIGRPFCNEIIPSEVMTGGCGRMLGHERLGSCVLHHELPGPSAVCVNGNCKEDINKESVTGITCGQFGLQTMHGHVHEKRATLEGGTDTSKHETCTVFIPEAGCGINDKHCGVANGVFVDGSNSLYKKNTEHGEIGNCMMLQADMAKSNPLMKTSTCMSERPHKDLVTSNDGTQLGLCLSDKQASVKVSGDGAGGQSEVGFSNGVPAFSELAAEPLPTSKNLCANGNRIHYARGINVEFPVVAAATMAPLVSLQQSLQSVMAIVTEALSMATSMHVQQPVLPTNCSNLKRRGDNLKEEPEGKRLRRQEKVLRAALRHGLQSVGSKVVSTKSVNVKEEDNAHAGVVNAHEGVVEASCKLLGSEEKAILAVAATIVPSSSRVSGCGEQVLFSSSKVEDTAVLNGGKVLCTEKSETQMEISKLVKQETHENGAATQVETNELTKENGVDLSPVSEDSDTDDCYTFLDDLKSQENWWFMSDSDESSKSIRGGCD